MQELKASELAKMITEHILEHGDESVLILDNYNDTYKPIHQNQITKEGNKLVIKHECDCL